MHSLVVKQLSLHPTVSLNDFEGPIISKEVMGQIREAKDLLAATQITCNEMLAQARRDAEVLTFETTRNAQKEVWTEVCSALQNLQLIHEQLLIDAPAFLINLSRQALERMLITVPPEWPAISSVNLVVKECANSAGAFLHVNTKDFHSICQHWDGKLPCQLIIDEQMKIGDCRMVCNYAEFNSSFTSNIQSFIDVLGTLQAPTTTLN